MTAKKTYNFEQVVAGKNADNVIHSYGWIEYDR